MERNIGGIFDYDCQFSYFLPCECERRSAIQFYKFMRIFIDFAVNHSLFAEKIRLYFMAFGKIRALFELKLAKFILKKTS